MLFLYSARTSYARNKGGARMRGRLLIFALVSLLLGTASVFAQEASLVGTITDEIESRTSRRDRHGNES